MDDEANSTPLHQELDRLYERFILKTAIRGFIWLILSYGILYFFPEQTWVWTVGLVFIGIGVLVGLGLKAASLIIRRRESDPDQP